MQDRRGAAAPRRLFSWLTGTVGRKGDRSYRLRWLVQGGFALTCVILGVLFARFYLAARAGRLPLPERPPGVEGFLPISGLMGLVDWIHQGALNRIHPAATVLVLLALALAFLLRKSFCSWICPVGFLSEALARLGRRLLGRNLRPGRWLDVPLRGLKYLLMGFFLWSILTMGEIGLRFFLDSPYNRVADLKMGLFFVDLGLAGGLILGGLVLASVFIQGFWCRYLCPYGALLGLFSWFSPTRVVRHAPSCTDCGLCDRVCMARLPVSRQGQVLSPECTGCLDCVAVCPKAATGTLQMKSGRRGLSPTAFAVGVLLLFLAGYAAARLGGVWQNGIDDREYIQRVEQLESGAYAHPGR